jgi:non-heme chloroperoxidase
MSRGQAPVPAPARWFEAVPGQRSFDPVPIEPGPIRVLDGPDGRRLRYLDLGAAKWTPFVFFGGLATSVGAFGLTEFGRRTRESLSLRAISVERNGLGETPLEPGLGYPAAVDDVLSVLGALGIDRFSLVAISGGGPFAAALAARTPERVRSLHLASAAAGALAGTHGDAPARLADIATLAGNPAAMWEFPAQSPVHAIPGFMDAARAEGIRALPPGRGELALGHEWQLLSGEPLPDLSAVRAPAYLYWGAEDEVVPSVHAEAWARALPNVVARHEYPGERHDVQYRHWAQILHDLAQA